MDTLGVDVNDIPNSRAEILFLMLFKVTAILGGSIFYQTGPTYSSKECKFNQQSIKNVSFALFYTITVSFIFSMLAAV
ncbi:hypothetical protein BpHYR1_053968, partial [Brachionus plicatilis]